MPPYCICLESKLNTVTQNKQISDISLMQPWLTVMKFLCVCLSGGGQGGSCSSLWLWTPHVSLWKHPVWKQQWTLFLPLKGNTHTHTHTHTHTITKQMELHCFSLFSRWKVSWRPDYGTRYLCGHNRRSAHVSVIMYPSVVWSAQSDHKIVQYRKSQSLCVLNHL